MLGTVSPYGRPNIPNQVNKVEVSYLVRALANGYVYYPSKLNGEPHICAAVSPLDAEGFTRRRDAVAFSKRLEREKANELCVGRPPYTRIEVRTDRIEICAETEESSASDVI